MFIYFFNLRELFLPLIISSLTQGKGSYLFLHSIYQYSNLTNVTDPVRTFFFTYMNHCRKPGGEFLSCGVKLARKNNCPNRWTWRRGKYFLNTVCCSRLSQVERTNLLILSITSTIKQQMHLYNFHLKHLNPLRHVSIFLDHHQGVWSFFAKIITYSRFSSFL